VAVGHVVSKGTQSQKKIIRHVASNNTHPILLAEITAEDYLPPRI